MASRLFFLLLLFCVAVNADAQPFIGQRDVLNFYKQAYNAGKQNWNIKQDKQGRLYFANNEGVLTYDGTYWKLYPLPNKTIVWSVDFGMDNRLYVGGQDEMGYFSPDKNGNLSYTSLKDLLDESDQKFADIWNIVALGGDVFFRSNTRLFRYHNNSISVYQPWSAWIFLGLHQQELIAHDEDKGLLLYRLGKWESLIPKAALPDGFYITSITPFGNKSLVTTSKDGLYLLNGNQLEVFPVSAPAFNNHQHFTSSAKIDDNNYLIGTYNNGFYHIDSTGAIIQNFSKKEGLQNSNIKSLFTDNNHNIWLGLDNGIDFIPFVNAVKHINPTVFNDAGGYAAVMYGNNLYFAMSNGIYELPLENISDFSNSKNNISAIAEGQAWQLSVFNNYLLAGKEDGFFQISNHTTSAIDRSTGYWIFQHLPGTTPAVMAAGNYQGVTLFQERNNAFIKTGVIRDLSTSARFLATDSALQAIWISHPYRGVYKINMPHSNAVKLYTKADGLPSTLNNHVYTVKHQIVIATEKGIYHYNPASDRFVPDPFYTGIFDTLSVRYLKEDNQGNIWFVHEKTIGVVDLSGDKPQIIYLPELKGRIMSGFENIYPINKNNILVGGEQGFYHINYETYKQNIRPLRIFIRTVKAKNEEEKLVFGGYNGQANADSQQSKNDIPSLSYHWNSFHFEYTSPLYEQQSNIEYSCYLEGFDKNWSEWTKKTEKDYTNLPAGFYSFSIHSRTNLNTESPVCSYSFYILPPWYNNIWAWCVYAILALLLLYWLYKQQEKNIHGKQEKKLLEERKKYEEEQRNIAYLHQLELEKSERELVQLKNEKLESEIEFKNAELAATAMNLVQKKEFLLKIKDGLNKINQLNKPGKDSIEPSELKKIVRSLSEEENLGDEWEQFSIHFNKVHSDFLVIIKEKYPDLKPHELKLCAYLRMNLSSKEIAHLMSISVRGVEISRYRVRKKLQLPTETNMFQFLFDLESDYRRNRPA